MMNLFRVHQERKHTVTVDVNETHSFLSIDRITMANTATEARQATEVKRHEEVPVVAGNTGDAYVMERINCHKNDHDGSENLAR